MKAAFRHLHVATSRLQVCNAVGYREGMTERDRHIPDLVSKAQAAEILGISHQAVQQMVTKGRLKGAQAGTTWVFRRAAVEAMAKPLHPCLCSHDKSAHGRDSVLGENAGYCGSCSCAQFNPAA